MRRWQLLSPKRLIPVFLASVTGSLLLIKLFNVDQQLGAVFAEIANEILRWVVILTTFAILVGVTNVIITHGKRLARRDSSALYSLALLSGFVLVIGVAVYDQITGANPDPLATPMVQTVIEFVYTPLSISLVALLTFFGLSAALRAFGSGRTDAIVLVVVATGMMILQLPLASRIPAIGEAVLWIQQYLALAGIRGLILGGAIGAMVASMRILLGVDRPYLDR